jgi:hypothetical protein
MPGLKYPLQEENKFLQSKIVFSIFEVDPPEFQSGVRIVQGLENTWEKVASSNLGRFYGPALSEITGIGRDRGGPNPENDVLPNEPGGALNSNPSQEPAVVSSMKVTAITGGSVSLYLPIAYQVNESLNYDTNVSLNASGAATVAGLNAGSDVVSSAARGIMESFDNIGAFFDEGTGGIAARLAAERLARSPAGFLVPEGIRNAIGLVGRVTVNPNVRTAFRGVNIREFAFQFKFLPKSAEESLEVKKIIRLLRRHAYPEEIRPGGIPLGYKYPDLFKIRLLSGKEGEFKNVGTPIKMAQLRNISTVYNPTTTALHPDGSPTEIDLNLGFVEYKTISRDDIDNEDNDAFYEYYGKNPEFERFVKRDGQGEIIGV